MVLSVGSTLSLVSNLRRPATIPPCAQKVPFVTPRAVCCHTGSLPSEGLPFPEVSIDCVPLPFRLPDSAEPAIMGKRQVHP